MSSSLQTATLVATSGLHRPLPRLKHEYVNITTNDKHGTPASALDFAYGPLTPFSLSLSPYLSRTVRTHYVTHICSTPEPLLKVLLGSKSGGGRTIVFCNDMQSARSTHHFLTEQGFNASCMHSGASTYLRHAHTAFASQSFPIARRRGVMRTRLSAHVFFAIGILPKRRAEYFEQFASGECPILVCTDIASRGLDTTAVNYCAPRHTRHTRHTPNAVPNRLIV